MNQLQFESIAEVNPVVNEANLYPNEVNLESNDDLNLELNDNPKANLEST